MYSCISLLLFLYADSSSTSVYGKDLLCPDDVDLVRLQQPLTPYNRQDDVVPTSTASAAAAGDVMAYWDNCRQRLPFLEHLLPALLRRVAGGGEDVRDGGGSGGDLFACSDCSKRYSSASNLARHRITHQQPTTTTTTAASTTTDRRVTRQCPHCAKVDQSLLSSTVHRCLSSR